MINLDTLQATSFMVTLADIPDNLLCIVLKSNLAPTMTVMNHDSLTDIFMDNALTANIVQIRGKFYVLLHIANDALTSLDMNHVMLLKQVLFGGTGILAYAEVNLDSSSRLPFTVEGLHLQDVEFCKSLYIDEVSHLIRDYSETKDTITTEASAFSACDIAYIIVKIYVDMKLIIENSKLQKLMYFIWIEYYNLYQQFLFIDSFIARPLGPSVGSVYAKYATFVLGDVSMSAWLSTPETYLGKNHLKFADLDTSLVTFVTDFCKRFANTAVRDLKALATETGKSWDYTYNTLCQHMEIINYSTIIKLDCIPKLTDTNLH